MTKRELKAIIKEELLKESTYNTDQLSNAEKDHDWKYNINVKFQGTKNSSKFLSIDQKTFNKIKTILK